MIGETTIGVKAVTSAAIAGSAAVAVGSVSMFLLVVIGTTASILSFFYDWAMQEERRFGLEEFALLTKYISYGVVMQIVIYFAGVNHGNEYVNLPSIAWGLIAAICAGSAVAIVNFATPLAAAIIRRLTGGHNGQ